LIDVLVNFINALLIEPNQEVKSLNHFVFYGFNPIDVFARHDHNDIFIITKVALVNSNILVRKVYVLEPFD